MYQYVCRYSDVIQFLLKRIKSTIFVTDMKMGMNKVLVCNRNGYGIELFCFFSISNSAHNRIEIFDSIVNSNRLRQKPQIWGQYCVRVVINVIC